MYANIHISIDISKHIIMFLYSNINIVYHINIFIFKTIQLFTFLYFYTYIYYTPIKRKIEHTPATK